MSMTKQYYCCRCKYHRPAKSFPPDPSRKHGIRAWCLNCEETKFCSHCKAEVPLEGFSKNHKAPDGYSSSCKQRSSQRDRQRNLRLGIVGKREHAETDRLALLEQGLKRCGPCQRVLPLDAFRQDVRSKNGKTGRCRECAKRQTNKHWSSLSDREKLRRKIVYYYHLTLEQYDALLDIQQGVCAVCKTSDPGPRGWHIDHDHQCCPKDSRSCGRCVRGLLCGRCNRWLGYYEELADSSQKYLDETPFSKIPPDFSS